MDQTMLLEPLQEVASISVGNAATALAKLIGKQVTVSSPSVTLVAVEQVSGTLGPAGQVSSAGLVKIQGDAQGLLVFSLDPTDAEAIAKGVIQQQTDAAFTDTDQAVFREMINIVGGTALTSLATFLDMELLQSIPASTTDMLGAVLDPFIAELGTEFEKVLLLQEVFTIPAQGLSLKLVFVIDPPSTTKMLQKITEKLNAPHGPNN